jgi:predicted secreted protein
MATAGVFNGTNLLLKVEGTVVGHTTSCTLSVTNDMADATTKDSSGWSESLAALKSGEISFDGLVDYSDANNAEQLLDLLIARTQVTCVFGTATTGDSIYTAEGFISSLEQSAEMEAAVTFSGTITLTGAIVKSVNA